MAAVPPNLKAVQTYMKLAKDYDRRDPVVAYFCRMYAVQKGIKLDSKSPDCKTFLFGLMDQLEQSKKQLVANGNDAVANDIVGQAHVETKTINLFTWADTEDRKGVFNKNITKAFYSASLLFDVLTQFGEPNDECRVMQKYSKWKATYLHKCLQSGETPIPGPEGSGFESDLDNMGGDASGVSNAPTSSEHSNIPGPSGTQYQQPPPSQYQQPPNTSYMQQPGPSSYPSSQPAPGSYQQPVTPAPGSYQQPVIPTGAHLDASQVDMNQVKKHCKFAMSSLEYEDVPAAVDNITKALKLLTRN